MWTLTAQAGDFRRVPAAVRSTPDGGHVPLDEAILAVVAHQGVDLIAPLHAAEHPRVLHDWWLPASHWRWGRRRGEGGEERREEMVTQAQPTNLPMTSPWGGQRSLNGCVVWTHLFPFYR